MQRHHEIVRDQFGNPSAGSAFEIFATGTSNYATIYTSDTNDNPTTVLAQPIVTGADGRVAFAINDGDYDLKITYPDASVWTRYRVNFFDSTTATTVPVSSIALAMPTQFAVAGSPGTSMTVTWGTQTANTVLAGPTSGGAATPAFRALVAADITPIAVDLTTAQTAAGNKIWSGTATFNAAVTNASTTTLSGALTVNADATFGTNADIILDKTSKGCIGSAGTYGYKSAKFLYDGSTSGTAPTITVLQSGIRKWAFSASATNEMIFGLSMPHDYAEGTDVIPYLTWTTGGTNAGVARWALEYTIVKAHSQATMPANATIYVETAGSGIALRPVTSLWTAITGTVLEPDALVMCRVYREGGHVNDTQADVSFLLDFGLKYQSSRPFGTKNSVPPFNS